ncbi:MarR family winged helix-turn-helix transcriptional regulator [Membranihabitans maritimus]|uniref:MarR family winged helix-turn-helix transcriptional regulator n=1 Tax=Membranihabitans maritimus TaxID=2904244 RepID=UPI001F181889|nr:MarR family transcriptional regulator [Membranihabitans maritimus]
MRTIEEEIQQSKFKSKEQKVHVNIVYTGQYISQKLESVIKKFDINLPQFNIMSIVRGQNDTPINIKDIQRRMVHQMANTSRVVTALVSKGLAERTPSPNDKREVTISLTKKGHFTLEQLDDLIPRFLVSQFSHLSEEEIEQLNNILNKVREY